MINYQKQLTFRGHRIAYYHTGSGPLLTFIHGFPTSGLDWRKVWSLLENNYQLLAIDLLGYGNSAKPRPYNYSIFEQADLVEATWNYLGIKTSKIIAHDYGSTVAIELLHRHKHGELFTEITSALLLNGGIVPGAYKPRPIQRLLASKIGPMLGIFLGRNSLARNFRAIFGPGYDLTENDIDEFWGAVNKHNGKWVLPYLGRYLHERKAHAQRWQDILVEPGVPLHYFWGLFDPISGRAVYEGLKKLNPSVTGIAMEDVGHYPQWERAEELAQLIEDLNVWKN